MNRTLLKPKRCCELSRAKKIYFLLLVLCIAHSGFATNCIAVKQVKADYKNKQVTIAITWTGCGGDASSHRNTAWVFVDYRTVTNGVKSSTWNRATISAASAGTVVNSGNNKGVWIYGANNTTQTVTLTLNSIPAKYDWCAYATDYPPNIGAANNGIYTLRGSLSFVVSGNTIAGKQTSDTVSSLTDATGCPGCIAVRDFKITGSNVNIPCCPGLTKVGGINGYDAYCRDLTADNANSYTGCNIEIKAQSAGVTSWTNTNALCDAANGWRWPTPDELRCMWQANDYLKLKETNNTTTGRQMWLWSNSRTGYDYLQDYPEPRCTAIVLDNSYPAWPAGALVKIACSCCDHPSGCIVCYNNVRCVR